MVKGLKLFTVMLIGITVLLSLSSCEKGVELYRIVNCSDKEIATYKSSSKVVTNKELFNFFKSKSTSDTVPIFPFRVSPHDVYRDFGIAVSFEHQFSTTDGLMHLFIIDAEEVRKMCKKASPDSSIVKSIVLKRLDYSQSQLEKKYKTIVYCDDEQRRGVPEKNDNE